MPQEPCLNPLQDSNNPRALETALVASGPALLAVVNGLIIGIQNLALKLPPRIPAVSVCQRDVAANMLSVPLVLVTAPSPSWTLVPACTYMFDALFTC